MNENFKLESPELVENPKNPGVYTLKRIQIFYPSVFKPSKYFGSQDEELWFGLQIMLPKSSKVVAQYNELCKKIKQQFFGTRSASHPMQDGDNQKDENGMPKNDPKDFLAGHYYFKMSSKFQPKIKNYDMTDLEDERQMYSGAFVNVMFTVYDYDNKRTGIGFNPVGVQKLCDAPMLVSDGGSPNLEGLFEDYTDINNQAAEAQHYDIDEDLPL